MGKDAKRKSASFTASSKAHHEANISADRFITSAFEHPRGDFFASVTSGLEAHVVSVWDTRNASLVVSWSPPDRSTKITCVAWGKEFGNAPKRKRKSVDGDNSMMDIEDEDSNLGNSGKNVKQSQTRILALGTSQGEVQIFSPQTGSITSTLSIVSTGATPTTVTDFQFSKDYKKGYATTSAGEVYCWRLSDGTVIGRFRADSGLLCKLQLDSTERLMVAGQKLKLFDGDMTATGKLKNAVKEFQGHATSVIGLTFTKDSVHCVSAAADDRFVSVWNCQKEGSTLNVASLTLESPPLSIDVSQEDYVLAVNQSGEVNLWQSVASSSSTSARSKAGAIVPRRAEGTISVRNDNETAKPIPILSAAFVDDKICIVYGSTVKPTFERVSVLDSNGKLVENMELIRSKNSNMLMDAGNRNKKSSTKAYAELAQVNVADSRGFGIETGDEEDGATMADRLTQMALGDPTTAPSTRTAEKSSKDGQKSGQSSDSKFRTPTATSLHAMLSQAIHSGDKQLLERSLMVNDIPIIFATVRRLQPAHIVPFLEMLVSKLQSKPSRAASLVEWIRAVVVSHAAFLMTNPQLVRQLGGLYQTLDTRVNTFQKFIKLSGRLDLVMSQISLRSTRGRNETTEVEYDGDVNEAEAVFDERNENDDGDDEAFENLEEWDGYNNEDEDGDSELDFSEEEEAFSDTDEPIDDEEEEDEDGEGQEDFEDV
ncbi:WD repeat-containing protein 43 [Blyttiomyces sp. JEL0837]|nr:WD repeat-containing protein 43 [Blyttiomyces sp. JEL0837]